MPERPEYRIGGLGRLFFGLGIAFLLTLIAYHGRMVLIPVVIAGFLSFLIVALKDSIRRIPLVGKFVPNWLSFIPAFIVIAGAFILFVQIVRTNIDALITAAPAYQVQLREIMRAAAAWVESLGVLPPDFVLGVDQVRAEGLKLVTPFLSNAAGSLRSLAGNMVTIFLYTVFILLERGAIIRKVSLMGSDENDRTAIEGVVADIGGLVRKYVSIKTLAGVMVAAMSYAILLVLGIDFAGFWALLIFTLNYVPIIGSIIAVALPVLLALVQPGTGGPGLALIALILLVAVQQLVGSFIEPRMMGRSLNVSPLIILLSLAIWGSLWGFAGMLLCVPIMVAVMLCLSQFHTTRPLAILMSQNGEIASIRREQRAPDPTG